MHLYQTAVRTPCVAWRPVAMCVVCDPEPKALRALVCSCRGLTVAWLLAWANTLWLPGTKLVRPVFSMLLTIPPLSVQVNPLIMKGTTSKQFRLCAACRTALHACGPKHTLANLTLSTAARKPPLDIRAAVFGRAWGVP